MFRTGGVRAIMAGVLLLTTSGADVPSNPFAFLWPGYERTLQAAVEVAPSEVSADGSNGVLSLLTYNMAGLPQFISGANPVRNASVISRLLNLYPLTLIQEDFSYHGELNALARHPHRVIPTVGSAFTFGNGLSRFSVYAQTTVMRVGWQRCHGYLSNACDCLAIKGFSVATTHLADDARVDIYNLHAEAGHSQGDIEARANGFEQLRTFIERHSGEHALIVAGDTNLRGFDESDEPILQRFLTELGLTDVCRALDCGVELVDRVMFRNGPEMAFEPIAWRTDERFVDKQGNDLSDHQAVGVRLGWRRLR